MPAIPVRASRRARAHKRIVARLYVNGRKFSDYDQLRLAQLTARSMARRFPGDSWEVIVEDV